MTQSDKKEKIYVAGHLGMVGSAIVRSLRNQGQTNIIIRTHAELDLTRQVDVENFFYQEKPDKVYLAASKVGGIYANNTYPADFIYQNLMVEANVIDAAFRNGVKKLLFLGSSCIYPRLAPQPITEAALLTGLLEPTNEPYAIAKIAGIKLCKSYNKQFGHSHGLDYRSVMPTNLYGPGDNYHPENSHVIPALLRRFHMAKETKTNRVAIWGSGKALREFLYVDDMAEACLFLMEISKDVYLVNNESEIGHINVGYGKDVTIAELAHLISKIVGYSGEIVFDISKPDGAPRKLLDSSQINKLGWKPKMNLHQGLEIAYKDLLKRLN